MWNVLGDMYVKRNTTVVGTHIPKGKQELAASTSMYHSLIDSRLSTVVYVAVLIILYLVAVNLEK